MAPNRSTTLVLELTGEETGTFAGTVSFNTNDDNEGLFEFDVTGTVTADVGEVAVTGFGLANDTGTSDSDKITIDGTLTGIVHGNFGTNTITVEFDQDGDGTF